MFTKCSAYKSLLTTLSQNLRLRVESEINVLDWRNRQALSIENMKIKPADFQKGVNANLVLSAVAGFSCILKSSLLYQFLRCFFIQLLIITFAAVLVETPFKFFNRHL